MSGALPASLSVYDCSPICRPGFQALSMFMLHGQSCRTVTEFWQRVVLGPSFSWSARTRGFIRGKIRAPSTTKMLFAFDSSLTRTSRSCNISVQ